MHIFPYFSNGIPNVNRGWEMVNYGHVVFEQPHNLMSSKIGVKRGPFVPSKMISPHYESIEWQSEYTPKKKKQPSLKKVAMHFKP